MEFNRGMVGVLLVILSLIASVGIGVVTNVETTTVQKDVEEYVADITGGFESEKNQAYTDYNPSSNYNGYTNNTYQNRFAVDFEPSVYVNNYPMTYSENPIVYDVMTTTAPNVTWGSSTTTLWYEIYDYTSVYPKTDYDAGNIVKCVKFSDMLTEIMPSVTTDLKYIEISISTGKDANGHATNTVSILTGPNRMIFDESYAWIISSRIFGNAGTDYTKAPYSNGVGSLFRGLGDGSGATEMVKIRYDVSNNALAFYMPNGSTITTSPAADVYVTGTHTIHDYYDGDITTTSEINVSYSYENSTQYIDTRYGVGIRNDESVEWTNKQMNGLTSIAFSVWDNATKKFDDTGLYSNTGVIRYYDTEDTDTITVSRSSGRTYVALNGNTPIDIGTWKQIQLDIDSMNGKLTAYPIGTWDNFNNYSIYGTSVEIGEITRADLKSITWTANSSFRLEIENTMVFFNTYGIIMVDPHITITDLWPNYNRFAVRISGVATIGNSIKIGSATYPINDHWIFVNGTAIDVTDMKMEYKQHTASDPATWDVTISSGKDSVTINVPNTYMEFIGSWYFSAGFYEIVTKNVTERTWNSIYDWAKGHVFFWMAAILLILSVVAYKFGYMDGLSAIILITTEVILFIIGGTT